MVLHKVQKVTKSELSQALQDAMKNDDELSFLQEPSYDAIVDNWVDAFQEDPMALWLVDLGDDVRTFDKKQKRLLTDFERSFMSWPTRQITMRHKGLTIGVTTNSTTLAGANDPTEESTNKELAGAMALVPSGERINTFWDIVTTMYHIGLPPVVYGKTKKMYGKNAAKRFFAMSTLEKRKPAIMNGERKRYIYIHLMGVKMSHHGQGLGGKLMRTIVKAADSLNAYLYLETESVENESFYHHYGFYTHETAEFTAKGDTSEKATIRMFLMVRNPNGVPPNDKN